jgi:predicted secreted protein with PEFG-CTERM motif
MRGAADQHVSRTFSPPSTNALVGETVQWSNADQVTHSVTSGTLNNPDGKFDSGPIAIGQSFSYTLTAADIGVINFYDKTYPWMTGTLNVQATQTGYKIINNVGHDAGDGKTTFNVQYSSPKDIISSVVNTKDKSVTFTLVGKTNSSSTLVLNLPTGLLNAPFLGVWLDNLQTKNFTVESQIGTNVVKVPITPLTEQVSVVGSSVVPEFGPIAEMILVVSIIATILVARFRLGHKLV